MAPHGAAWRHMAPHCAAWRRMALHGAAWCRMARWRRGFFLFFHFPPCLYKCHLKNINSEIRPSLFLTGVDGAATPRFWLVRPARHRRWWRAWSIVNLYQVCAVAPATPMLIPHSAVSVSRTDATFLAPTSCRNGGLTRGSLVAVRPPSSRRPLSQGSRGRTTIFTDSSTANLTRTSSEAQKSPAGKKTLMGEREREHGKSIGLLASTQSLRSSPWPEEHAWRGNISGKFVFCDSLFNLVTVHFFVTFFLHNMFPS